MGRWNFRPRAAIPVVSVPGGALLAVKVGVYGHCLARREVVNHAVGARPVSPRVPPERRQRRWHLARWFGERERGAEIVKRHGTLVTRSPRPARNARADSGEESQCLPPSSAVLHLGPALILNLFSAHCDLNHIQKSFPLLKRNLHPDKLNRGSARGVGRGLGVPGWFPLQEVQP